MNKRELALKVLEKQLGLPYIWGGNDPVSGFDCSGLMIEVLQSVGIIAEKKDYTAHGLKNLFPETDVLEPGNMVFWDWNGDGKIDHVEMIAFLDDNGEVFTVGASGGDSSTTTEAVASSQNAYIKQRPLKSGYIAVSDPFAVSE